MEDKLLPHNLARDMAEVGISSWIGHAANASHYMGKLRWYGENHEWRSVTLTRILTSKDAKDENRNHRRAYPGYYTNPELAWGKNPFEKGQEEERFPTREAVVEAAKKKYVELGLTCGLCVGTGITACESKTLLILPELTSPPK